MATNKTEEKVKELTDTMEQELSAIYNGDEYKNWLDCASKFPNYSINNQLLIMSQREDATRVCGFHKWKEFNRQVDKGAKGIYILAPQQHKTMMKQPVLDENGVTKLDEDGKPITEEKERVYTTFRPVVVFDVSDTSGEPLPEFKAKELSGKVENFSTIIEALKSISPVPVEFEDIQGGAKGYFSPDKQRIAIKNGMDELQIIKTLAHEVSHSLLHDRFNPRLEGVENEFNKTRPVKEIEAESSAYIFCKNLGLDTSDYSLKYVVGWEQDPDMKAFKNSLDVIRLTASHLINKTNELLLERDKEIEKEITPDFEITETSDAFEKGDNFAIWDNKKDDYLIVDGTVVTFETKEQAEKYLNNMDKPKLKDISLEFRVNECGEYPNNGITYSFFELDEALQVYKDMPDTSMGKGLSIVLHCNEDKFIDGMEYQLAHFGKFCPDARDLLEGFKNYPQINEALDKAEKSFIPSREQDKKLSPYQTRYMNNLQNSINKKDKAKNNDINI